MCIFASSRASTVMKHNMNIHPIVAVVPMHSRECIAFYNLHFLVSRVLAANNRLQRASLLSLILYGNRPIAAKLKSTAPREENKRKAAIEKKVRVKCHRSAQ